MSHWPADAIVYHLFPLGACGGPRVNDGVSPPVSRLSRVRDWLDHVQSLGCNTLLLGPVFESHSHGYDTIDLSRVDRRLGTNDDLHALADDVHARGMRLVLDAVFNHVGRDHAAFRDLQTHGKTSRYRDWFVKVRFGRKSPLGDPFTYEAWQGYFELAKLNLHNAEVRRMILGEVETWIRRYHVDGLRLDTADVLDPAFLQDLHAFCRGLDPAFWLMGEVVHGDYRRPGLDAVTNYEVYQSLWSAFVNGNLHEIAACLERQFGPHGLYRGVPLYNFVDNHDVSRIASVLGNPAWLLPVHVLLFTMPGVPSIYAGSEWGLTGEKGGKDDWHLRPTLDLSMRGPQPDLAHTIARLATLRRDTDALRHGDLNRLAVGPLHLAFSRRTADQEVIVVVNAAPEPVEVIWPGSGRPLRGRDVLHDDEVVTLGAKRVRIRVPAHDARVIVRTRVMTSL